MLNLNLTAQSTQRTSFDALELTGYELPEEQLRFVAGGKNIIVETYEDCGDGTYEHQGKDLITSGKLTVGGVEVDRSRYVTR